MNENVFFFLKNKSEVKFLYGDMTLKEGLEEMRKYTYTAIPVIDRNGYYLGSLSEGDFLWYLYNIEDKTQLDKMEIKNIIRQDYMMPVKINASIPTLLQHELNQNYVPVVDDRNIFIGIVTRKSIIEYFLNKHSIA